MNDNVKKKLRMFPDYTATGVWGQIGEYPYVYEYGMLREMGASYATVCMLKAYQALFECNPSDIGILPEDLGDFTSLQSIIKERLEREINCEIEILD